MDSQTRTLILVGLGALLLAAPLVLSPPAEPKPASPPPAAEAPTAAPTGPAAVVEPTSAEALAKIETEAFEVAVSSLNGGLKNVVLREKRYHDGGEPIDVVSTDRPRYYPLALDLDGFEPRADDAWKIDVRSPREVVLSLDREGLAIVRKIEAGGAPYQLWVTTRIENRGSSPRKLQLHLSTYHYVSVASEESGVPFIPVRSPNHSSGLCKHGAELEREARDSLAEGEAYPDQFFGRAFAAPIVFAGVENVYFLSAIAPEAGDVEACRIAASRRGKDAEGDALGTLFAARVSHAPVELGPGEHASYKALAYFGPKLPERLAASGHSLHEAIDAGWFGALAEGLTWLLREIYELVGNWGIAIIVLTLIVKVVLLPLTAKQMQSMAKMKSLKPDIDKINELYPDDREKKGAAMMELYRKRGINPMAGCFPVLLQLPIWFSLYQSLATNVQLFRAPFALWWTDLSGPDPWFSLPLALGVLMFVQQKITPAAGMDPVQQKMMLYMMPTMITAFMLFLPAGLCLYMFTNSALSIAQQKVIERRLAAAEPPTPADQHDDSSAPPSEGRSSARKPEKRRSRRGRT